MRDVGVRIAAKLVLILILTMGSCWAGPFDKNPGMDAIKHKHYMTDDVTGEGFVMVYQNVNTNNLSHYEYMHGSGTFDYADIIKSEQKSGHGDSTYWVDEGKKLSPVWKEYAYPASSTINYTKQSEVVYSPHSFSYGTGWYASHPVVYNSLIKDKTIARQYQEGAMMHHQVEYARALKADMATDMNCTGNTDSAKGKGSIVMDLEDEVTEGTVHISELMTSKGSDQTKLKNQGWKNAMIEVDENYVGSFHIQKKMKLEIEKSYKKMGEDWLPCCFGGFADVPTPVKSYNSVKGQAGIFDCTCRETALSTYKPAWDGSAAQFPNDVYASKP